MNTHANKTREDKSQAVSAKTSQLQSGGESTFQFVDNRPEAIAQRKLQEMANNNPQAKQATQFQAMAENHSAPQKQILEVSDQPVQKKENKTGLPDNLKTGMENLSGMSLDDVKVHRNSDKPAQLQAHAYAQGTDIHLGPGQEKHLPHEAWHVVQQKQGRVKPTMQMKGKVNINDDTGLEKEADLMGAKSMVHISNRDLGNSLQKSAESGFDHSVNSFNQSVIQGMWCKDTEYTSRSEGLDDLYELLVNKYGLAHDEDGHCVQAFLELLKTDLHFESPNELISAIQQKAQTIVLPGIDEPAPLPSNGLTEGLNLAPTKRKKEKTSAGKAMQSASKAISTVATVTSLGTGEVIDKVTGANIKEGLPIPMKRKVEIKIGQFFSVLGGASEAVIPVVGGALAAPFTAVGGGLEAHGRGMSKKQAAFQGGAKAGAGAAIGAIPVWGNIDGVAGLMDSGKSLFGKIKSPSKMEAINHLKEVRKTMNEIIVDVGEQVAFEDPEFAKLYRLVEHYLEKYNNLVSEKINKGEGGLLKYADFDDEY